MNVTAILDKYESKKLRKFYYLFLPYFYILEYIAYKKYWKLIIEELCTNDIIIKWLDDNEFGFNSNRTKIYKKDLIVKDSFFDNFDTDEIAIKVRIEFVKKIADLIKENLTIDIENYINLYVYADKDSNTLMKYYCVEIRYYRYEKIKSNLKFLLVYLISIILLTITTYNCYNLWIK